MQNLLSVNTIELGDRYGLNIQRSKVLLNSLSANPTKLANLLKQFVGNLPMNYLSGLDNFVGLGLKGLNSVLRVLVIHT